MKDTSTVKLIFSYIWPIYWIASLSICLFATALSLNKLKERREKHLWSLIFLQITLWLNLFLNFAAELNWDKAMLSDVTRIGAMILAALLIVTITSFVDSNPVTCLHKGISRFFYITGFTLAIHYLVSSIFFFSFRYDGSVKYFGGYRYIPAHYLLYRV